jgi:hypothetical protein
MDLAIPEGRLASLAFSMTGEVSPLTRVRRSDATSGSVQCCLALTDEVTSGVALWTRSRPGALPIDDTPEFPHRGRIERRGSPRLAAAPAVTIANVWFGTPFAMILIAAGLVSIADEQYEAASRDSAVARVRVVLATGARSLAFALVIFRPMYRQIPIEIEEASRVDGCTTFPTFCRVVLPIMRIPLIVVGGLSFVEAYGQFVYPLTMPTNQDLQPATVGIYGFIGAEDADCACVMAPAFVFALPVLALFLALQQKIVAGLTIGALKQPHPCTSDAMVTFARRDAWDGAGA